MILYRKKNGSKAVIQIAGMIKMVQVVNVNA